MRDSDLGRAVVRFIGWLLIAAGGLILLTAGGCSVLVLISSLSYPQGLPGSIMMILVFGGIPILVGLGLIVAGWGLARVGVPRQPPRRGIPSEDDGSGL